MTSAFVVSKSDVYRTHGKHTGDHVYLAQKIALPSPNSDRAIHQIALLLPSNAQPMRCFSCLPGEDGVGSEAPLLLVCVLLTSVHQTVGYYWLERLDGLGAEAARIGVPAALDVLLSQTPAGADIFPQYNIVAPACISSPPVG